MNRRRFLQSLAAFISLPAAPALSLGSTTGAAPAIATVPANARFWAIYMSGLHGECSPRALQNMLNIPAADAKKYLIQLVADGTIKPNPLMHRTASQIVKSNEDSLFKKVKKRLDMKSEAENSTASESNETTQKFDNASEPLNDDVAFQIESQEVLEEASDVDGASTSTKPPKLDVMSDRSET